MGQALCTTLSAEPDSPSVVQGLFGVLGSRSHLTATSPIQDAPLQGGASELTISEKEVLPADPGRNGRSPWRRCAPVRDTVSQRLPRGSHAHVACECGRVFQLFGKDGAVNGTAISRFHRGEYKTREVVKPVDRRRGSDVFFFYEIEDFAKAVAGEIDPDVNADDAYVFTKMLQALYASARNNRRVAIQV